jgi:Protein of unknown function (DUF3107)
MGRPYLRRTDVDIRIGVIQTAKELVVEMADATDRVELRAEMDAVMADENRVLWLTDKKGRTVAIPSRRIAYIDLGADDEKRRVGFGS